MAVSENQARSQAEVRKPGLQHHMCLEERNPDFVACEQQRRRSACASAQSDQRIWYSLSGINVTLSDFSKFSIFDGWLQLWYALICVTFLWYNGLVCVQ